MKKPSLKKSLKEIDLDKLDGVAGGYCGDSSYYYYSPAPAARSCGYSSRPVAQSCPRSRPVARWC